MKSIIVKYWSDGHGVRETEYAVNQSGNGLWMNGKQVIGTCDFHASTPRDLVRKLRARIDYPQFESFRMVRGSARGW